MIRWATMFKIKRKPTLHGIFKWGINFGMAINPGQKYRDFLKNHQISHPELNHYLEKSNKIFESVVKLESQS